MNSQGEMVFKVQFIPAKRRSEDADGIDSLALSETKRNKVIGKGLFTLAVLAKYNGKELVLKEMFCNHWDEGKKNS